MAHGSVSLLSRYRSRAVFAVDKMAVALEGEDLVATRKMIWDTMAQDPLFEDPAEELTMPQQRQLAFRRTKRLVEYDFVPEDEFLMSPAKLLGFQQALTAYDMSIMAISSLTFEVHCVEQSSSCATAHNECL